MAASDDTLGLETPEADRVEQLSTVVDDPDESAVGGAVLSEVIDADEADILEQAIEIPADEDYPATGV